MRLNFVSALRHTQFLSSEIADEVIPMVLVDHLDRLTDKIPVKYENNPTLPWNVFENLQIDEAIAKMLSAATPKQQTAAAKVILDRFETADEDEAGKLVKLLVACGKWLTAADAKRVMIKIALQDLKSRTEISVESSVDRFLSVRPSIEYVDLLQEVFLSHWQGSLISAPVDVSQNTGEKLLGKYFKAIPREDALRLVNFCVGTITTGPEYYQPQQAAFKLLARRVPLTERAKIGLEVERRITNIPLSLESIAALVQIEEMLPGAYSDSLCLQLQQQLEQFRARAIANETKLNSESKGQIKLIAQSLPILLNRMPPDKVASVITPLLDSSFEGLAPLFDRLKQPLSTEVSLKFTEAYLSFS